MKGTSYLNIYCRVCYRAVIRLLISSIDIERIIACTDTDASVGSVETVFIFCSGLGVRTVGAKEHHIISESDINVLSGLQATGMHVFLPGDVILYEVVIILGSTFWQFPFQTFGRLNLDCLRGN